MTDCSLTSNGRSCRKIVARKKFCIKEGDALYFVPAADEAADFV